MINEQEKPEEKAEEKVLFTRLPADLLDKVKGEADRLNISVSAFTRMLLAQYFDGIVFQRKSSSPPFVSGSAAQAPAPGESPTRAGAES